MWVVAVGLLCVAIWVYLLCFRGGFWRVAVPEPDPPTDRSYKVVAVVPARNEAETVAEAVTSLLGQSCREPVTVILVDDHSEDGTAAIARDAAAALGAADRLDIVRADPLPAGWTGKLWAVHQGIARAASLDADFLLLSDADIRHDLTHVDTLLRRAVRHQLELTSEMVALRSESWVERRLIPAFVFFFFMLYPPRFAADPRNPLAAAAGGTMLIRPATLARIGGIRAIRDRLIDDCALAAAVKNASGRIRLDVTHQALSLRRYDTAQSVWTMVARTAYTQLNHSPFVLVGTVIGLIATYLAPIAIMLYGGWPGLALGGTAWLAMAVAFTPTLRLYRINPAWGLSLPAVAVFYLAATIGSAVDYWRGRGGNWKGRAQASSA